VVIPLARPSNQISKAPLADVGPNRWNRRMSRESKGKALIVLLAVLCGCRQQESASDKLHALAPRSERPIEARLTGFDWTAMRLQRSTKAGLLDPARLELAGAASSVIQSLSSDSSARGRHEAGAAYLLIERDRDAIDALEAAVRQSPKNASYWSDLAAARYTLAVREKRAHELPQALADADHALRIAPALPDALFNRALIVEALGVTEAARRAWQRYVAADPSTHWSDEAMRHLGSLRVVTTRDEFQHRLAVASHALAGGNDAPIVALARNFPQEARTWSEGPLLATWADAVRGGDAKKAAETLTVVRKIGAALTEINHDQSVADAVAAIDRADPAHVQILADAHAAYRDGRLFYRDRRISDAQQHLQDARDLFARGNSPMVIAADYYIASCIYDSNRPIESSRALDALVTRFDATRYPALAAQIGWERSLCNVSAGEWEAAIHKAMTSRKIFARLGETQNRGEMDLHLANYLNHASQPAAAWKAYVAALPVLSSAGSSDRIRGSLLAGIYTEHAQGRHEAAISLAGITLEDLHHVQQPVSTSITEAARAEALSALGDNRSASQAIERARLSAKTIANIELRRRTAAAIDIAEAVVVRDSNPGASLQLLDRAVAFYKSGQGNAWLPKAYLERGRTHVRAKDDAAALDAFKAGIREVDAERSSIADKELRATFYDAEPQLFTETIALLLRNDDAGGAFEFSDGARARSVYEQSGKHYDKNSRSTTAVQLRKAIPSDTALVEYALLPDSVVIFSFSSSGSSVVRVPTNPVAVKALVERYTDLLQHRGDLASVQRASTALYQLLIAPVAARIAGSKNLVIVPDRQLHTVPFAALYNESRGRYVIDDFDVSVAPSAASMLQQRTLPALTPVLVVGDPHDEGAPSLPEAVREAEEIAAMYESSTLLAGDQATRARFITVAQQSGMIHYAGHADSDAADPFGVLHLAADGAHGTGDLNVSDIAAIHFRHAPLVILSACGTIRGNSEHVEGMPSIARAFLAAGARSVVGTLWEVDDDAVSPLFRRMHRELHNGANASAALRAAQVSLAHDPDPRLRHPATWAPVELLGYSNEQPRSGKKRSN
jgi:CHAT domain-containing protein